ncbi:hypothetical protein NDU88_001172 [Pleurodeles waltl]|uniref:EF-hand domain-containing protein n=1 Tax=Pleurodeles waltl TaxID=8319 RepID=A0AAV7P5Z7_PLEWA|nr:hypothetical protein NDU88_001172 [Pleurodeles waltl]
MRKRIERQPHERAKLDDGEKIEEDEWVVADVSDMDGAIDKEEWEAAIREDIVGRERRKAPPTDWRCFLGHSDCSCKA